MKKLSEYRKDYKTFEKGKNVLYILTSLSIFLFVILLLSDDQLKMLSLAVVVIILSIFIVIHQNALARIHSAVLHFYSVDLDDEESVKEKLSQLNEQKAETE